MDRFWDIVEKWDRLGQGVFFLILGMGVLYTLRCLVFYITTAITHRQPPYEPPES